MGKGDRRTKRGKIWRGTFGKFRKRKTKEVYIKSNNRSFQQPDSINE